MIENFKYVKNALDRSNCEYLTNFLTESIENNLAVVDDQCENSWSVHHHEILDRVLEAFTPKMEEETGKKLFPTYAYARYYQRGEVLKCHIDRPACEYSATITLGHSGGIWTLWISDPGDETDQGLFGQNGDIVRIKSPQKFKIEIGDAVIYKGCVAPHWRDEFIGEWQTQIFLHYVDQNGPYAKCKFDERKCLAHQNENEQNIVQGNTEEQEILYWFVPNAISETSCDQMIEKFETLVTEKASIGSGTEKTGNIDLNVRDVNKIHITNEIGIGATLTGIGINANSKAWNFDITHSNQSEYLRYDVNGHYRTHVDTFCCPTQKETRKVTVLAFLNDDFEGGKLYLENGYGRIYPEQERGTIIIFPSFINHGVEPVTKGIRRSIVTWLVGPWFK